MKKLLVVSGPSGAGIRDIVTAAFALRKDLCAVTPVTARKMKPGEQDGIGFFFYDLEGWNALKDSGGLLETTEFAGNDYGTSRAQVEQALSAGRNVLLNLEVERAAQVKENMPEALCVYLEPSPAVLEQRIRAIARSPFEVSVRLAEAARQRALSSFCDLHLNSDDPARACGELLALLED
jgi:guanylate kinase